MGIFRTHLIGKYFSLQLLLKNRQSTKHQHIGFFKFFVTRVLLLRSHNYYISITQLVTKITNVALLINQN